MNTPVRTPDFSLQNGDVNNTSMFALCVLLDKKQKLIRYKI